jgi:hypothetical protein
MTALSISEVLSRAADLLAKDGAWSGGGSYHSGGGCHCTALAIDHVAGDIGNPDGERARKFFANFLGLAGGFVETTAIYRWNDDPERTQAEVVAKLREAAELAREQGL